MRDVNRIYPFINEIASIWMQKFPDLRFGQLMTAFDAWLVTNKESDIFYIGEARFLELFKEFAKVK